MKAIKIQTTILLPDDGPKVPVARIIERINRTTRCELLDLGMFNPGCVITQQDETPAVIPFPTAEPKDAA